MASKNLHLLMTAQTKEAEDGLNRMQRSLEQVQRQTAGLRAGMGALVGGADPFQTLKGTAQNLVGQIPYVGPAIQGGMQLAEGFFNKIRDTQKAIADQGKAASSSGASIEGYSRLLFASGGNAEYLDRSLFKLSEKIGDAALNGGETAAAFERLGLDAQKLSGLKTDQQFMAWAAALGKVQNTSERAALAQKTMGKSWHEAMELVNKGTDWINSRGDVGKKSGAVITAEDVAAAREANAAWKQIDESLGGVWNRLAIQMAPTVTSIAKDLKEILSGTGPEWTKDLAVDFLAIKNVLADVVKFYSDFNLFSTIRHGGKNFGGVWDTLVSASEKSYLSEATAEVWKFEAAMKEKAKAYEKEQREIEAVAKAQKKKDDEQREMERRQKLEEAEDNKNRDLAMTQYDKFIAKLQSVAESHAHGALTAEQEAMALSHIADEYDKMKAEGHAPGGHEIGSAGANSAMSRAELGASEANRKDETAREKLQRVNERLLDEARAQTRKLDGIEKANKELLAKLGVAKL